MFGNQSNYKSQYEETLRKINYFGTRIQNDNDKIVLMSLINNLKYLCGCIEPQESYDMYNK